MNADGNSDESIVPSTQANNTDTESVAESVEERNSAERNTDQHDLPRTPSRNKRRSLGLAGVREAARNNRELKFTALLHHINEDLLHTAFFDLKKNASAGIATAEPCHKRWNILKRYLASVTKQPVR